MTDRDTDGQRDRETEIQTDRDTDGQRYRRTEKQAGRQKDIPCISRIKSVFLELLWKGLQEHRRCLRKLNIQCFTSLACRTCFTCVLIIIRGTERQRLRDRGTERQRDRETDREIYLAYAKLNPCFLSCSYILERVTRASSLSKKTEYSMFYLSY
jgi:hypothetical protein